MSRRGYMAAAGVLAIAAAGGTGAFMMNGGGEPAKKGTAPTATAAITRGDLVDSESVDGTLTYDGERTISSGTQGVVTWAPDEGDTVTRGKRLLEVNDKPVTLMYGSLPMYRTLRQGVEGQDVEQLERNLDALGYGGDLTVDEEFTSATADAVEEWQDDKGLPETGNVDASQIVFETGALRVTEVKATEGGQLGRGRPAMTVTGTKRVVRVDLDAAKQDLAKEGAKVTIELPSGKDVSGKITEVGTVAKSKDQGGQEEDDTSTIDVEISLSGKSTGKLDEAPVSVDLESGRAKNVLSVPIEALLALREGGFGVEVVEAGGTRIVPVETGTYGSGRVEITGNGLREGLKVGVPSS